MFLFGITHSDINDERFFYIRISLRGSDLADHGSSHSILIFYSRRRQEKILNESLHQ